MPERRATRGRGPSRAELEAELEAARKTIAVLIERAERRDQNPSSSTALFEAPARMEQIITQRTREVEEKSSALATANEELRDLTENLDRIARQRNRALLESEAQLREKNEELARLNTMKGEFISIVAHELRTPLTSIVGYLDLMTEGRFGRLPREVERPIRSVRRNAYRLMRLVDEMLDVSRIDAGKVILHRAPCSLAAIAQDVVTELSPLADTKRHTLEAEIRSEPVIDADADKIHQVIANLVANAIRYTPEEGAVKVIVDDPPEEGYLGAWGRLRVRDNGIGIAQAHLGRIFEPFSMAHGAKHHTSFGPDSAGLGLYIARGLVDLHGGFIAVDSREEQYTEFTVLLPLARERPDDQT
jgi:signal transduction histidine kinase